MSSPAAAFPAPRAQPASSSSSTLADARERVVRLLTDRYADDSLTVDEFDARLDQMHALTTPESLDAMARALATAPANRAPAVSQRPSPGHPAGLLPARVRAVMSNMRREGAWVVPPRVQLTSVMSEIRVDLREAVLPPVCEIDVFALMGTVSLYLPPDVEALVDVDSVMASVHDRRPGRGQTARGRTVRVTGSVIMSELKIRHEDW
jgi:hypothetical protein